MLGLRSPQIWAWARPRSKNNSPSGKSGPESEFSGPRVQVPRSRARACPNAILFRNIIWILGPHFLDSGASPNSQGPDFLDPGPNVLGPRIPRGPRGAEGATAGNQNPTWKQKIFINDNPLKCLIRSGRFPAGKNEFLTPRNPCGESILSEDLTS